ncbi:MAG: VWA domain-containing protein [Nitrospirae bacterium]|nr:VWA domain-containing protein [Nitrospirota bacterium]
MYRIFRTILITAAAMGLSAGMLLASCSYGNKEAAQDPPVEQRSAGNAASQPQDEGKEAGRKDADNEVEAYGQAVPAPVAETYSAAPAPAAKAAMPGRMVGSADGPAGPSGGATRLYAQAPRTEAAMGYMPPPDQTRHYYQDFGRDKFEHKDVNPIKLASEEPVSTFSIDVDTASYGFVRKSLSQGHLPARDAVRVEEMVNYFEYGYETPTSRSKPFKPTVAVYPTPWNPGTKLLHIGIKGLEMKHGKAPRANLVFLLDVSGSMDAPDKLPLLKQSLAMLVDNLRPADTVAVVVYAGAGGTILEPTEARNKSKILAALERLRAGGSTAGGEGIRQAYALAEAGYDEDAVNRVILATDGDFNVGITNPDELQGFVERKRNTGIFLSVLGFGTGNYNDQMMQKLAQNGNGNAAYIDTLNEARKVLVHEASSTLFPIAKDVKIQVEFNPARVAEYRLIGYETRMLKREDFNNDQVDAGEVGSGSCVTAIYEVTPVGSDSRLVDDLRYRKTAKTEEDWGGEYAFLKIRYKLPREDDSRLIKQAIGREQEYKRLKDVPADIRFAASVAAFGQLLKGAPFLGGYDCTDIAELARPAKGDDPFGYRAEFVNLVEAAKSAGAMAALP